MILAYLILSHLIGDFILQPTKLVLWKMKSKSGVFVHACVHFIVTLLILLPLILLGNLWLMLIALIISFSHFCIDQTKINYDIKHDKKVLPFLFDQLMHLFTILICYFFIREIPFERPSTSFFAIYSDLRLTIFLTALILVSKVVEIYNFQAQREKNKNARLKINTDKMLNRIIVMTFLYGLLMILSFYVQ